MARTLVYTARDYDSLLAAIKTKATELFPDWTDFSRTNAGYVILELQAMIGDQLHYYENQTANESFIGTCKRKKSMIALCKLIDYILAMRVAANVTLKFTLDETPAVNVYLKQGDIVSTEDDEYEFEIQENKTILAGSTGIGLIKEVSGKNQTVRQDIYDADGSADQEFLLTEYNYLSGSISIDVAGDSTWIAVDDFLNSGPTDKHFSLIYDTDNQGNDIVYLVFGDGTNGAKPSGEVTIDYKTGGGILANSIQPGKITKIVSTIYDANGNEVNNINVTNEASPSNGQDAMTLDEARIYAPKSTKASERTVAREDFINNAESVPGVVRAQSMSKRQDASMPDNTTYVYVVPTGGGVPSDTLKTAVETMLTVTKPILITHNLYIKNPNYKTVNIEGTIEKKTGYTAADVKTRVDAALTAWFDYLNVDALTNDWMIYFYMKIPVSKIIDIIHDVEGVRKVTLTVPAAEVVCTEIEIPALGSLSSLTVS